MKNRFVIDMQITGYCNMSCDFCCGTTKKIFGPSFNEYKKAINKLIDTGCTTLVFGGGEPLIRNDIVDIIEYTHIKNLEVYLSTNGLLFFEKYRKIKKFISCIGLPLDGSSTNMNKKMSRNPKVFENTLNILKYFKQIEPKHTIKIGTIVSKINLEDIVDIGEILFNNKKIKKPDTWRLYQFSPLGKGFTYKKRYEIDNNIFENVCSEIKKQFVYENIVPLSHQESNDSYIFINPALDIELLTNDKYIILGNLKIIKTNELKKIFSDYKLIKERGENNRRWLDKK